MDCDGRAELVAKRPVSTFSSNFSDTAFARAENERTQRRSRALESAVAAPLCRRSPNIPSAATAPLEREIEARVHHLYALTPAEIQLVEEATK